MFILPETTTKNSPNIDINSDESDKGANKIL
jgi:hypothetical protein